MLTNISIEVVFGLLFLFLSNTNSQFGGKELTWRMYITVKAIPIAGQVELFKKYKFAKAIRDINFKILMVYIAALKVLKPAEIMIHLSQATQIAAFQ